ncbi:MAG: hypothetical protein K2O29_10085 [Ruminococcus sp.]|nr:hypothetical protein [Ruminococcus sp.]MDE6847753.1 hypothetical protein [Ruminococcus sp.]MDE7138784.1 hypothetical protein [Ruminococcus sp.]
MKNLKRIKGINELLKKLPEVYKSFYHFGTIVSLNYGKEFDYEKACDYVDCIDIVLTDYEHNYKIEMKLTDIIGDMSFNITNGFFSGLAIEDHFNDGFSDGRYFLFTSNEQDIHFNLWCRDISVKLV